MKKLKLIIASLLVPCILLLSGCSLSTLKSELGLSETNLLSEEQLESLKGENGLNGKDGLNGLNGKDGKDGDNIDLYEIYLKLIELDEYDGTFAEFVKDYLNTENTVYATSKALRSTVSIFAGSENDVTYMDMNGVLHSFTQKYYGAGSGIIYSLDKTTGDALIITNYHVIYDGMQQNDVCSEINIILYGNEQYSTTIKEYVIDYRTYAQYYYKQFESKYKIPATFLGGSLEYDIAVLKISGSELLKNSDATSAIIQDSDTITAGETVISCGNPSGAGLSSTTGTISKDSEQITMIGVDNSTKCTFRVLRTDSAINPGNSGGGLFNAKGELIGIVNAKMNSSTIDNIAYAIPTNVAINVANNIIKNCNGTTSTCVKRALLGISIYAINSSMEYNEATLKTCIVETICVNSVTEGGILDGKLNAGDILTSITINYLGGGTITKNLTRNFQLVDLCLTLSVGDKITICRKTQDGTALSDVCVEITQEAIILCK